jgi:hypothetical protein
MRVSEALAQALVEAARVDMTRFDRAMKDNVEDLISSSIEYTEKAVAAKQDPKKLAVRARAFLGKSADVDRLEKGDQEAAFPVIMALIDLTTKGKVTSEQWEDIRKLRDAIRQWQDAMEAEPPEEARKKLEYSARYLSQETRKHAARLLSQVNSAIRRVQAWQPGTEVVIEPGTDIQNIGDSGMETFRVVVGKHGADFTVFTSKGKVDEIDDVLEAGDTDFFHDPIEQVQYFDLVRELKSPGSTQRGGKMLTLWTARPVKDRQRYEKARTVPTNIFLTTDPDRAVGLSRDLGGGRARDVWKVVIDSRYLVQTLKAGHVRDYQVVGKGDVPVKKLVLDMPGEA